MIRSIAYLKNKFKQGACPQEADYADALDTFLPRNEYSTPTVSMMLKETLTQEYSTVEHTLNRYVVPTVLKDEEGKMSPVGFDWCLVDEKTVCIKLAEGVEEGEYQILLK